MENREFNKIIQSEGCIKGGTKEACLKVQEVLRYAIDGEDKLFAPCSRVKIGEFIEAVKILMAFAKQHDDEYVELYYCEADCARFKSGPCPGDCALSEKATKLCPYYIDEGNK